MADQNGSEVLLYCNSERTLVRSLDPATGQSEVRKLLLRGSLLDAERECAIGRRLAHLPVAQYLGAEVDPVSHRPCTRMRFHDGIDLDALIARHGARTGAEACRILRPVAKTLAAMHTLRAQDLPQGLCHGDVKPANLMAIGLTTPEQDPNEQQTLLLDFEHTAATGSSLAVGTPGFAGPESEDRAALAPTFDIYGLGAVVHWLVTGQPPRPGASNEILGVQNAELRALLTACLSPRPSDRPDGEVVFQALSDLDERLQDDPLEPARDALLAGDLQGCQKHIETAAAQQGANADLEALRHLLDKRQRLLRSLPHVLTDWAKPPADDRPVTIARTLQRLAALLRRFPRNASAVHARAQTMQLAAEALAKALPSVSELVRQAAFDDAYAQLTDLQALAKIALAAPGHLQIPGEGSAHMPDLLQRAPLACLEQEFQRLKATEAEYREHLGDLERAEAELQLDAAEAAVDRISALHGGTSIAISQHRDRLHRLGFYVERIGRAASNLERLHALAPDQDQTPLVNFVRQCATAARASSSIDTASSGATMGLRQLQLALVNLAEEFPTLADATKPGLASLNNALDKISDEAWELLAQAQEKLQSEPVPVRPLQLLLSRIDTFRSLESLVDRPDRSRSALLDRIESLRLRLEQVRATRDRLARGAEEALAKGHWTTGLFDMERAVTQLNEDNTDGDEANVLQQRLEQARKRKREIETAQQQNVELNNRYSALQDDLSSTAPERLHVLQERLHCLQFLELHAQKDRGSLYARDLRDVEILIAQEHAGQAEAMLDRAEDPEERLRIAQHALAQLESACDNSLSDVDALPGRLQRLLEHWRLRASSAKRELDRQKADHHAQKRRRFFYAAGAAAMLVLGIYAVIPWTGAAAGGNSEAITRLHTKAAELPQALQPGAQQLVFLASTATTSARQDPRAWLQELELAQRNLLESLDDSPQADQARALIADTWHQALLSARSLREWSNNSTELEALVASMTERAHAAGMPRRQ